MDFKDFEGKCQELIGKTVLYESGFTYSEKRNRSLLKIEKVTKTGFRLSKMPSNLFSLTNGKQKGLNHKFDMATISQCTLLTDDEANQLREQWKRMKAENELRNKIMEKVKSMTFEQLQKIDLL